MQSQEKGEALEIRLTDNGRGLNFGALAGSDAALSDEAIAERMFIAGVSKYQEG